MLENSRTTYTNALVRFLAWNMPFHAEHHAWPSIPFHALPRDQRADPRPAAHDRAGLSRGVGGYLGTMRAGKTL